MWLRLNKAAFAKVDFCYPFFFKVLCHFQSQHRRGKCLLELRIRQLQSSHEKSRARHHHRHGLDAWKIN